MTIAELDSLLADIDPAFLAAARARAAKNDPEGARRRDAYLARLDSLAAQIAALEAKNAKP